MLTELGYHIIYKVVFIVIFYMLLEIKIKKYKERYNRALRRDWLDYFMVAVMTVVFGADVISITASINYIIPILTGLLLMVVVAIYLVWRKTQYSKANKTYLLECIVMSAYALGEVVVAIAFWKHQEVSIVINCIFLMAMLCETILISRNMHERQKEEAIS